MGVFHSNIKLFTNTNPICSKNKYCVSINQVKKIYSDCKLFDIITDFLEQQNNSVLKTNNINDISVVTSLYDNSKINLDTILSQYNNDILYIKSTNGTNLVEISIVQYSKHQTNINHNIKIIHKNDYKIIGSNLTLMGGLYHILNQQMSQSFTHCKINNQILDLSDPITSYINKTINIYQNTKKVTSVIIEQINNSSPSITNLDSNQIILQLYDGYGDIKEKKYSDHTFHRILFKQLPYTIYADKLYEIYLDNSQIDKESKLIEYQHCIDKKIHVKYNNIVLSELYFSILSTKDKLCCRLYKSDSTTYISNLISSSNNTLFDIIYELIKENYVNSIECKINDKLITLYDNVSEYDGKVIDLYLNDILVYVLKIGNSNKYISKDFGISNIINEN